VLEVAAIANRNGNHMVQHVLLPVNIHFHWNLFIFEYLTIFLIFILAAILKILITKSTTLSRFAMAATLNQKWPPKYNKSSDLGEIWFPSRLWCCELISKFHRNVTMSRCADYFQNFQNGRCCHGNHQKKDEKFKVLGIGWNLSLAWNQMQKMLVIHYRMLVTLVKMIYAVKSKIISMATATILKFLSLESKTGL
jgi:hypothetical protein